MTTNTYPPIRHFQLVRKTQYCLNYDVPVRFTRKLFHLEVFFVHFYLLLHTLLHAPRGDQQPVPGPGIDDQHEKHLPRKEFLICLQPGKLPGSSFVIRFCFYLGKARALEASLLLWLFHIKCVVVRYVLIMLCNTGQSWWLWRASSCRLSLGMV